MTNQFNDQARQSRPQSGTLFIVSAPSGAGKTTLVNAVLQRLGGRYAVERLVTYTSKEPRAGEAAGQDYHYLSVQEFERRVEEGFFLEWTGALGQYYGTQRELLVELETGRSKVAVIDRIGARQLVRYVPEAVLIWIAVPDSGVGVEGVGVKGAGLEVLRERLVRRGDTAEQIERRLARAKDEMEEEKKAPMYQHYIMNNEVNSAVEALEKIVVTILESGSGSAMRGHGGGRLKESF